MIRRNWIPFIGSILRNPITFFVLAMGVGVNADEPSNKSLRRLEKDVEVLRKQGQAAIKRLESVFEKEAAQLRARTVRLLQEDVRAASVAKDSDRVVGVKALLEKVESTEFGKLLDLQEGQAALKRFEVVFENEFKKLKMRTVDSFNEQLDAALEAKDLETAVGMKELIEKVQNDAMQPLLGPVSQTKDHPLGEGESRRNRKRIPAKAIEFGGHRYYLVSEPTNLFLAQRYAEAQAGHLCRINSLDEQAFLESLVTDYTWIDGSDIETEAKYVFSDGTPVDMKAIRWSRSKIGSSAHSENLYLYPKMGVQVDSGFGKRFHYIIEWDE